VNMVPISLELLIFKKKNSTGSYKWEIIKRSDLL